MKRLISICVSVCCLFSLSAQSVSKELATHVGMQYMRTDQCNVAPSNYEDLLTRTGSIDTTRTSIFSPTGKAPLYIVQMPEGWVIVASEFVPTPILASAPVGQFPDITDMPDGLKWLLSYYEDAMQYTRDSMNVSIDSILYSWKRMYNSSYLSNRNISSLPSSYEIDSIRSFLWNQNENNGSDWPNCDKVYDKFCPTWYTPTLCNHTYVGCTAVAMGLVMRYYRWPYSAFVPNTIDSTAYISEEKHLVAYNWNKMPSSIYNSTYVANVDEIAGLLRDCGYAAKMKYRNNGSSASFSNAEDAMENIFHFASMQHRTRRGYIGNWVNKLKTEIAADRPVIYAGYGSGGHAFVLCGYTSDNKFKINWGWADISLNNGAYSLDSLTPHGNNYNDDQEAIWEIIPKYPTCSSTYNLAQNDVNSNFEIYKGGAITAANIVVNNNVSGVIFSGESVTLNSGFEIAVGAEVYIDVKDMYCDEDKGYIEEQTDIQKTHHMPRKASDVNDIPSASKHLRDGQIYIRRDNKTYTISGQMIE